MELYNNFVQISDSLIGSRMWLSELHENTRRKSWVAKKNIEEFVWGTLFFYLRTLFVTKFSAAFCGYSNFRKKKYFAPGNGRSRRDDAPCPQCIRQCLRVCKRKFHDTVIRSSALGLRLESVLRKNNHFPWKTWYR